VTHFSTFYQFILNMLFKYDWILFWVPLLEIKVVINTSLIDWFIDYWLLTSREQKFSYIQDENISTSPVIYKNYIEMRENMGQQLGQRLLTAT
jgi:hypothetical protein